MVAAPAPAPAALCCALALALLIDLSSASRPLPTHGIFKSSLSLDQSEGINCYQYPKQKFKVNPSRQTGYLDLKLIGCPSPRGVIMQPLTLNVTVFDYQPYVKIDTKMEDLRAMRTTLHRVEPYAGTLYGVLQKCCSYPLTWEELLKHVEADDVIIQLPQL